MTATTALDKFLARDRASAARRHPCRLVVQQLLDPAQRAAQGLRVRPDAARLQRRLKLGSDGIRDGAQRLRCIIPIDGSWSRCWTHTPTAIVVSSIVSLCWRYAPEAERR